MDVSEKLVEIVKKAAYSSLPSNTEDFHLNMFVMNLLDHGVTVQEWIPVKEPPKEKGTYIVCTDNGGVLLGHWYGTEWNAGGAAKKHLAYWMEKPQPPKGE